MTSSPCGVCQGTGWTTSPGPYLVPPVVRCTCWSAAGLEYRLAHAGIPPEYRRSRFEAFRGYTDSLGDAVRIARAYADRWPATGVGADPPGLLLVGPAGVGKTHLVAALLRTLIINNGVRGLFYKLSALLRLMRDSYNPAIQTTERQILEPVMTCDLLVLDDLGAERLTDWVADVVDQIIDARYSAGLPLIATTNFADLDNPTDFNGLLFRVGFRTHSRLHAMCRFVTLVGADYRRVEPSAPDAVLRELAETRPPELPGRELKPAAAPNRFAGQAGHELKYPGGVGGNT